MTDFNWRRSIWSRSRFLDVPNVGRYRVRPRGERWEVLLDSRPTWIEGGTSVEQAMAAVEAVVKNANRSRDGGNQ